MNSLIVEWKVVRDWFDWVNLGMQVLLAIVLVLLVIELRRRRTSP
jgi:hypothetical protein